MIQRTYPTSSDTLVAYLQSSEFVGAWQTASGSRMKPAVRIRPKPGGASLIFGASRVQKDSRRPRFRILAQGEKAVIRHEASHQALVLVVILVGYLLCIVPGILVHIQFGLSKRYKAQVAGKLIGVLDAKFASKPSQEVQEKPASAVHLSSGSAANEGGNRRVDPKMEQLNLLLTRGLITEADYERKKAEVLARN